MPIVYEVPTHLNVEDAILFGLGAHQLVRLAAAGSVAYGVWDQAVALPAELRAPIAAVVGAVGLACAFVQPGGRPLDQWAFAAVLFVLAPRRLAWRRREPSVGSLLIERADWVELSPRVDWASQSAASDATDVWSRA